MPKSSTFTSPLDVSLTFDGTLADDGLQVSLPDAVLTATASDNGIAGFWQGTLVIRGGAPFPVDCWAEDVVLPFDYDATSGRCLDAEGAEGHNRLPVPFIRETIV